MKHLRLTTSARSALLAAVFLSPGLSHPVVYAQAAEEYYVGGSMNFASFLQEQGVVYKENGLATDPFASIAAHGGNIVRLEHHLGPYENQFTAGKPPTDWGRWERVRDDVANAAGHGLDTFLTFTFKSQASQIELNAPNNMPDAWVGLSDAQIAQNIYDTTYQALDGLGRDNLLPKFVSIGNEVNGAFVERPNTPDVFNPQRITDMMNAGFDAVRDIAEKYQTPIHAAAHIFGPDNADWWMNNAVATGLNDFDTLALSYYPGWHSFNDRDSFADLANWLRDRHGKELFILETAQPWSGGFGDNHNNIYNFNPNPGQPLTPQAQRQFLADMAADLISGGGLGMITWGTDWVSSNGIVAFADQFGPGSSWENNAYWDFNNNLHEGIDWMADIRAAFPLALQGDIDGDGFVGIADLNAVLAHWNQAVTPGDLAGGDLTGDGFIGVGDLNVVLGNWNAGAPPIEGSADPVPEPAGIVLLTLLLSARVAGRGAGPTMTR